METSEGKQYRSAGNDPVSLIEKNTLMWGIFLVGMIIGFVGVYLVVAQPMLAQLQDVQRQTLAMQNDVKSLVGAREKVWETNNLLSGLAAQQRQLAGTKTIIQDLRQLRQDLEAEAAHTAESFATLAQLTKLQDTLLEQRELAGQAIKSLDDIATIQQRLVKEQGLTEQAEQALAGIEQSKAGLDALVYLKKQIVQDTTGLTEQAAQAIAGIDQSKASLDALVSLKKQIVQDSTDVAAAQTAAGEMITLKNTIVERGGDTSAAQSKVEQLFKLQETLTTNEADLKNASTSLDGLLQLKGKLIDQTPQVADAMQNLEILSDFQEELAIRIKSLGGMQQSLMEIVVLETTIGRVARVIEPLVQISNVRRLGDGELRDAARMILEQRSTRISKKDGADRHLPIHNDDPFKEAAGVPAGSKPLVPVPLPEIDE